MPGADGPASRQAAVGRQRVALGILEDEAALLDRKYGQVGLTPHSNVAEPVLPANRQGGCRRTGNNYLLERHAQRQKFRQSGRQVDHRFIYREAMQVRTDDVWLQ